MALLIQNLDRMIGDAAEWRRVVGEHLSDRELRIWPEAGDPSEITYLAFMRPDFDVLPDMPNLRAIFSRSGGVDGFIDQPRLPQVPLGKIEPSGGDPMMTEYVVMHVLRLHREMPEYQRRQAAHEWHRVRITRPEERRIGFLGYGMMAKAPALVLQSLGFPVSAWVRSPKPDAEVPIFHGDGQLELFLAQTDRRLPTAVDARDRGYLLRTNHRHDAGGLDAGECRPRQTRRCARPDRGARQRPAVARVARRPRARPLPPESPLWDHPDVTVMPHVARRPTVTQLVTEMAANIRSLESGGPLLQEIDKAAGY